jgi:hypothetical protein
MTPLDVEPVIPVLVPYFCTHSWRSVPIRPRHRVGKVAVSADVPVLTELPLPEVPLPPGPCP